MSKYMKTFNGEKVFSLEYDKETLRDMVIEKDKEIERLNNIIKEVREYIEKENIKRFGNPTIEMALSIRKDKLLEILNRGE